jgi:hypothetical protein
LLGLSVLGSVAIVPYSIAILKQASPNVQMEPFDSGFVLFVLLNVATELVILSAGTIALGLWLGPKVGLGVPLLEAWLAGDRQAPRRIIRSFPLALALGVAAGVVVWLSLLLAGRLIPEPETEVALPSLWKSLLGSLGAGIREELWLRLGFMTVLVWIGAKLTGRSPPGAAVVWAGNLTAALIFGAMHLPQTALVMNGLSVAMVTLVLVLNGIGGVLFGWLYWRRNLFAAMVAHATMDVVFKAILPTLMP